MAAIATKVAIFHNLGVHRKNHPSWTSSVSPKSIKPTSHVPPKADLPIPWNSTNQRLIALYSMAIERSETNILSSEYASIMIAVIPKILSKMQILWYQGRNA